MKWICLLSRLFFGMAAVISSIASAQDFLWRTQDMTAEIRRDDKFLRMGQYLHMEQRLRRGESGWTIMQMDIPEQWHVQNVSVHEGHVTITNADGVRYDLTRDNVSKLDFDILSGGKKTDEQLEVLWRHYALAKG